VVFLVSRPLVWVVLSSVARRSALKLEEHSAVDHFWEETTTATIAGEVVEAVTTKATTEEEEEEEEEEGEEEEEEEELSHGLSSMCAFVFVHVSVVYVFHCCCFASVCIRGLC
jgi:hypothetical protein